MEQEVKVMKKMSNSEAPGATRVYLCIACNVELPPGLDGNRCPKCENRVAVPLVKRSAEKAKGCTCDVSTLGKVLRADCPVCLEMGGDLKVPLVPDLYPVERMHSEDGGVLAELIEKGSDQYLKGEPAPGELKDSQIEYEPDPKIKEWMEKEGWTFDQSTMRFLCRKDRSWISLREACAKYRVRPIPKGEVRITDGIMNWVECNSPWPEMTELEFNEFIETAFGPSELETYWKRGGWTIDRGKGEFTKGELHISIEAAVDGLRRLCEDFKPVLYVGTVKPVSPDEKIEPGMVISEESVLVLNTEATKLLDRAVGLLRRWYIVGDVESCDKGTLDEDTEAFLKEIDGADPD